MELQVGWGWTKDISMDRDLDEGVLVSRMKDTTLQSTWEYLQLARIIRQEMSVRADRKDIIRRLR